MAKFLEEGLIFQYPITYIFITFNTYITSIVVILHVKEVEERNQISV